MLILPPNPRPSTLPGRGLTELGHPQVTLTTRLRPRENASRSARTVRGAHRQASREKPGVAKETKQKQSPTPRGEMWRSGEAFRGRGASLAPRCCPWRRRRGPRGGFQTRVSQRQPRSARRGRPAAGPTSGIPRLRPGSREGGEAAPGTGSEGRFPPPSGLPPTYALAVLR